MAIPHHMLHSLLGLIWLLALSGVLCKSAAQAPTQAEIADIARELAERIRESKVKAQSGLDGPKVLVLMFPLSQEVADALKSQTEPIVVMERKPALDLIQQLKLPAREYAQPSVVAWLGWKSGAQLVVTGHLHESGERVRLDLWLVRVDGGKEPIHSRREFARTAETLALVASGPPPQPITHVESESTSGGGEPVAKPGKSGVSYPKCSWCPNPQFTDEARRWLKCYRGIVILRMMITSEGKARDISVVQGAACGLNERAVQAVGQWRFQPARAADGNPVAVWTTIEVAFSIL